MFLLRRITRRDKHTSSRRYGAASNMVMRYHNSNGGYAAQCFCAHAVYDSRSRPN